MILTGGWRFVISRSSVQVRAPAPVFSNHLHQAAAWPHTPWRPSILRGESVRRRGDALREGSGGSRAAVGPHARSHSASKSQGRSLIAWCEPWTSDLAANASVAPASRARDERRACVATPLAGGVPEFFANGIPVHNCGRFFEARPHSARSQDPDPFESLEGRSDLEGASRDAGAAGAPEAGVVRHHVAGAVTIDSLCNPLRPRCETSADLPDFLGPSWCFNTGTAVLLLVGVSLSGGRDKRRSRLAQSARLKRKAPQNRRRKPQPYCTPPTSRRTSRPRPEVISWQCSALNRPLAVA